MKIFRLLPFVFLMSDGCVERLELPVLENESRIVVDGMVTNLAGTHSVRLFRTASLAAALDEGVPITDATVRLLDDEGNVFDFVHSKNGLYSLADFQGITGRSYKLHFSTGDGKRYESAFQKLPPAGLITDVNFEFSENAINLDDPAAAHDVFRIYIDSKGNSNAENYFRWRWTAIYEALTRPELRRKPKPDTTPVVMIYDPLPCSGHIAVANGLAVAQVGPCECCTCWVTYHNDNAMVSNNDLVTRAEFNKVQVAQVPVDWKKFQAKFYINVEQLSLSEEVYRFWKNVQAQQEGTSDIFQPNIIRLKGNISCLSEPDEDVAGIFSVAGITQRHLFIDRSEVPKVLLPDTITNDCRKQYPGSTNVKPLFW